ncbi:trypsin-like peptidase domain-containing protein [Actinoplanes sp. CA-054009]
MTSIDPGRIAEILVTRAGPAGSRGSGYRVGGRAVLTAAHVVAGASSLTVRFDAGRPTEWAAPAVVSWSDMETDVAVLTLDIPEAGDVTPVRFARLGDTRAFLPVRAAGFPRWKLRTRADGSRFRELHDAAGDAAVLSNRRTGTLEITVAPPADDPDPARSPWEAMSGAAVWAGDRVVGVVAEHHRREGPNRLTAVRLDRCLDREAAAGRNDLAALLGVADPHGLPDAVPPGADRLIRSAYREQVRDTAPADGLIGRNEELDELAAFCAGDESFVWWQAPPWAGKSALMSTFVLHPPAGVDVVAFFVNGRLAAQSDSEAFTEALLDQLHVLLGEERLAVLAPAVRDPHRRDMLRRAADRAAADNRRLVLIVDGLDEDTSTAPGSRLASIGSLLPKDPGAGLRVIVSGRPHPPIPDDVAPDHPLRSCRVRLLGPSPYAEAIGRDANRELQRLLHGEEAQRDILGFIAASGGGLSQPDLVELTGLPPYEMEGRLSSAFGRTISRRDADGGPLYLFAHDTLRETAETQLGPALLHAFRDRLHRWAEGYRDKDWPRGTPDYLLSGYPRMLFTEKDLPRLTACGSDAGRQERLLDRTGGDAAALAEIRAAQDLVLAEPDDPDLLAMVTLTMQRERLSARNANLPTDLPAVWAALGFPDRAEALARSISDPVRGMLAMTGAVEALSGAGRYEEAAKLADAIDSPMQRDFAQVVVVEEASATGAYAFAERLLPRVHAPVRRVWATVFVAEAAARAHDVAAILRLVRSLNPPPEHADGARGVAAVVEAVVPSIGVREAARLVAEFSGGEAQDRALMLLAERAVGSGDLRTAGDLAGRIADAGVREAVTASIVVAGLRAGELAVPQPAGPALRKVASRMLAIVAPDEGPAPAPARRDPLPVQRAVVRPVPSRDAPPAGSRPAAPSSPEDDVPAMESVAAPVGHETEEVTVEGVEALDDPLRRAWGFTELARQAAVGGDVDTARRLLQRIDLLDRRAYGHLLVIDGLMTGGHEATVDAMIDEAVPSVIAMTPGLLRNESLAGIAEVLASRGQPERALGLVLEIGDQGSGLPSVRRARDVAIASATAGSRWRELATTVDRSTERHWRVDVMADVATGLLARGRSDDAHALFDQIVRAPDLVAVVARCLPLSAKDASARTTRLLRTAVKRLDEAMSDGGAVTGTAEHLAVAAGVSGELDLAQELLRRHLTPTAQSAALRKILRLLAAERPRLVAGVAHSLAAIAEAWPAGGAQDEAFFDIAGVLADRGEWETAAEIAMKITGDSRSVVLTRLCRADLAAGRLRHAVTLAREIDASRDQTSLCAAVVRAALAADDLTLAEEAAAAVEDEEQRAAQLQAVITAAAARPDDETALRLSSMITDGEHLAESLTTIVSSAAARGDVRIGADVADGFAEPERHCQALTQLAMTAVAAGDREFAVDLAGRSVTVARDIPNGVWRQPVLVSLLSSALASGNWPLGMRLATELGDATMRDDTFARLSLGAIDAGALDEAVAPLRRIDNDALRSRVALAVTGARVVVGSPQVADTILATIAEPDLRVVALARLVVNAVAEGDDEAARAFAGKGQDAEDRAWLAVELAEATAIHGDPGKAAELGARCLPAARGLSDPMRRAWALARLAAISVGWQPANRVGELIAEAAAAGGPYEVMISAQVVGVVPSFEWLRPYRADEANTRVARSAGWRFTGADLTVRPVVWVAQEVATRASTADGQAEAYRIFSHLSDDWIKTEGFGALADRAGAAGLYTHAVTAANAIPQESRRASTLSDLALAAAGNRKFETAADVTFLIAVSAVRGSTAASVAEGAMRAGDWSLGVHIAERLGEPERSTVLAAMARTAADLAPRQAVDLAGRITDPRQRDQALHDVVEVLCDTDDLTADTLSIATAAAERTSDPARRDEALSAVASAYASIGDFEGCLGRARQIMGGVATEIVRSASRAAVSAGQLGYLMPLADTINRWSDRHGELRTAAATLVESGRTSEAMAAALARESGSHAAGMIEVVIVTIASGAGGQRAVALLREVPARLLAEVLTDRVIGAALTAAPVAEAVEMVQRSRSGDSLIMGLETLADRWLLDGERDKAITAARLVVDNAESGSNYVRDRIERARLMVTYLPDPSVEAGLAGIAKAAIAHGEPDAVSTLVDHRAWSAELSGILTEVIPSAGQAGNHTLVSYLIHRAVSASSVIVSVDERDAALRGIAGAARAAGLPVHARLIAEAADHPERRGRLPFTLSTIDQGTELDEYFSSPEEPAAKLVPEPGRAEAVEASSRGDHAEALAWALRITTVADRDELLLRFAHAASADGDPRAAKRFVVPVLAGNHWARAVPLLEKIDAETYRQIPGLLLG